MKKLLNMLTITTLTASVPAPLLANTTLERTKRDVGATVKDVTTGFDIKIKEKWNWQKVKAQNEPFRNIDNKWYFVIWRAQKGNNWETTFFLNNSDKSRTIEKTLALTNLRGFLDLFAGGVGGGLERVWSNDNGTYFKSVYCWNGNDKPIMPIINTSTGEITNWNQPTQNDFQQGILFSLAENDKTVKWSNAGMRLTVDGETNINIDNPNVTEVLWNGVKQNMLDHKVNINVTPETSEKTHKLVIKYDINGTKYTSEDIDVVMAAKIEPLKPIVKENLSDVIKFGDENNLGNLVDKNDSTIFSAITQKNGRIVDFSQIEITNKDNHSATLTAKPDSKSYKGSVDVKYNFFPTIVVKAKIDLTSTASGVQIDKDYLGQIDTSNLTNPVNTFYYANGKIVIKIKQPPNGRVVTGFLYGCDENWNKTSQSTPIDPVSGLEIDKGQYGSVDGRYLIELQHQYFSTKNNYYLQVSEKQLVAHYWDTPNGKKFEEWAEDNGEKNIRGSSASQLNTLFEVSKTWKQSLAHLDLKLDNFFVDNIQNVSQDEIDNYKTKLLAGVKEQVEKYVPDVVENIDYVISVDNLVAGDWTTSKDVKVQSVSGSTKLLSFTAKTIPVQQKEQPNPITPNPEPTPDNNKKYGLGIWAIFGIVVGSLAGLALIGWLFKRFVINPFILKPIREKKEKAFVAKTEKDIAQMKKDDEEWEAKQKGDK
ncbi:adhesin [Spiroplasma sp. hyd1]|uniref:adhesin n=1 Tax=Spiroplasma sp. hyd1 TaxID=1609976 RepID=UPI0018DB311E|nr:adhesin [Spiroplasma sp. hyd1]MBH8623345.1 adhesin [Spiroplasma sp. hyd1]